MNKEKVHSEFDQLNIQFPIAAMCMPQPGLWSQSRKFQALALASGIYIFSSGSTS